MDRVKYIDNLRGFAIILVVIGHLIQWNYADCFHNKIFNIIYCFHMPLFFFISGYTQAIVEERQPINRWTDLVDFIVNKGLSLHVPFLAWTYLVPLFFTDWQSFEHNIPGLWFLSTLLTISILYSIIAFVQNILHIKYNIILLITMALCVVMAILGKGPFFFCFLFCYIFGRLFNNYITDERYSFFVISSVISLVIFLGIAGMFSYGNGSADRSMIRIEFPASVCASIFLLYLFKNLNSRFIDYLGVIGKYTLGIYVCHFLIIKIPFIACLQNGCPVILQVCSLAAIAIIVCIVCIFLQKAFSVFTPFEWILYGKFPKFRIEKYMKHN